MKRYSVRLIARLVVRAVPVAERLGRRPLGRIASHGVALVTMLAAVCLAALGTGEAVAPNQAPAPGLLPGSWACYSAGVLPSDIVSGDFDGDGWLELAVSCLGTGDVYFYDNLGSRSPLSSPGVFSNDTTLQTPVGAIPGAASLGLSSSGVYVLSNVGIPGTPPSVVEIAMGGPVADGLSVPCETVFITTGDLDHEGVVDDVIVVLDEGVSQVVDLEDRAFSPLGVGKVSSICAAVGDMNQDGWQDVVLLSDAGLAVSYRQGSSQGSARFLPAVMIADGSTALGIRDPRDVAVGDFDSDGLLDVVVVGNNEQRDIIAGYARVFLNSPAAVGTEFVPLPAGGPMTTWGFEAVGVIAADFDGNGRDDFAVLNKGSDTVAVFLCDARPGLEADDRATSSRCLADADREEDRLQIQFRVYKLELQCGHQPVAATVGDFDFNGKLDIAVALLSATPEIEPQTCACVEVLFDVACGFHESARLNVPDQTPHSDIPGVSGLEKTTCKGCKAKDWPQPGAWVLSCSLGAAAASPFSGNGDMKLSLETVAGWHGSAPRTDPDEEFLHRLTAGGGLELVSRDLPLDFDVSAARFFVGAYLLDEYLPNESGTSLSAALTLVTDFEGTGILSEPGTWAASAVLDLSARRVDVAANLGAIVRFEAGRVDGEVDGAVMLAADKFTITPRAALALDMNSAEITQILAGISIERHKTAADRERAGQELDLSAACHPVFPTDDGKYEFQLSLAGSSLESLGFSATLSYVHWLCMARLALRPYASVDNKTLSFDGARLLVGLNADWSWRIAEEPSEATLQVED